MDTSRFPRIGARWQRRIALLALLVAASRALIPVGFMPLVTEGTARLVFCDGVGGAHHLHHGMAGHGDYATPNSSDGPCPFSLAAGGAPLPSLPMVATVQGATEARS